MQSWLHNISLPGAKETDSHDNEWPIFKTQPNSKSSNTDLRNFKCFIFNGKHER